MDLPLIRVKITGTCIESELKYTPHEGDEVEDLYYALKKVKVESPRFCNCRNNIQILREFQLVLSYPIINERELRMCIICIMVIYV